MYSRILYDRICQKALRGGDEWNPPKILLGGDFFIGWWNSEEKCIWPFEPFSKLKTPFCKYWTSTNIKISMTSTGLEPKTT